MIKAVLFDADGVILKPHGYFSQRLRKDGREIPNGAEMEFFKGEYKKVEIGKADLKEEINKYLDKWKWKGTVEELLEYWFSGENEIEDRVLDTADKLREIGINCYVASDHSRYRADDLMQNVGLSKHFDGSFFSGYVGYTKSDEKFFKSIIGKLNIAPSEILYFDDDPKNVEIAKNVGLNANYYSEFEDLAKVLKELDLLK